MTLVEIEKSLLAQTAICYRPGIWSFSVYDTGEVFPWFGPGMFGANPIGVGSLEIDHVTYTKVDRIADLYQKTFCQENNTVYVMNENYRPLWIFLLPKYNAVIGFTDEKPVVVGNVFYQSGLDHVPKITDKADSLEYARMKFKNETVDLLNTKGEYDSVLGYFGNSVRIRSLVNGALINLYEYYVKNIKISAGKAAFICGDRREKLAQKLPNGRFSFDEYPKMKKELEGETRQDVYGWCEWVKCVCVDELDIYTDPAGEIKKPYRAFYASRKITGLNLVDDRDPNYPILRDNHVWVKQTQVSSDDEQEHFGVTEKWTPCPVDTARSDFANGLFAVDISYCMPAVWSGYDVPEVFEVRASGRFNPQDTPLAIIKDLLEHYCGIPYNSYTFNTAEIENEIGALAPVGIVYDSEMGVFEAIEKLQDSSDCGFQFKTDYNRFTARRDDIERPVSDTIKLNEITDIEKVEIDMNRENYATIVDVLYNRNYYRDTDNARHYEGKQNREELLMLYGIDKTYTAESYLKNLSDAKNKSHRLEKLFKKTRPVINNVPVLGHAGLRVYDIINIDLRIPAGQKGRLKQAAVLFGDAGREAVVFGGWQGVQIGAEFKGEDDGQKYRAFGGVLRCEVMSVNLDLKTMVNTVSLLEAGL